MEYSLKRFLRALIPGIIDTFYMVSIASIISIILGFIIASILYMSSYDGLRPNKKLNKVMNTLVNVIRSFPFIILVVALIPFTRLLVGTAIGRVSALVPLSIAGTSFVSRIFENSFREVDKELVEAIKSFGATDFQLMTEVVLVEAKPSIILGMTVSLISILGSSAAAGAVGAGGLGSIAIDYGYHSFDDIIMYGTVAVLVIIVQIIQGLGNYIYGKTKKSGK